jgi:hypothetical protein
MARRHNHYEAAFENYVRSRAWPYVPVDEHRRAIFGGARVKSFDFLVYPPGAKGWLVDIKGRKFPYERKNGRRFWENWVTHEDLEGLRRWQGAFGAGFEPVLVFCYWLLGVTQPHGDSEIHLFRDRYYAFVSITAGEYAAHARARSDKWGTVTVPTKAFRGLVASLETAAVSAARL